VTASAVVQLVLYSLVLVAWARPLGAYMARVSEGEALVLRRIVGPAERLAYRPFNTAVSFATNTDWQSYAGEATLSYLTQMLGLAARRAPSCRPWSSTRSSSSS